MRERELSVSLTVAVPSASQTQAGNMIRPPSQLVEDSDEVFTPEESNVSKRANEIDSELSSSFTFEGASKTYTKNLRWY